MGIVNAVDICKYPQHFNRLLLIAMNKYVLFLIFIFSCIGCGETNEQDANTIEGNTDTSQITIAPVTNLKAKITQNPNELYLTWTNPITVTNMLGVEIYYKQKGSNDEKRVKRSRKEKGMYSVDIRRAHFGISVAVVITTEENQKESPLLLFHRIRECLWQIVVRMCLLNSLWIKRKERFGYHPKIYLEIRLILIFIGNRLMLLMWYCILMNVSKIIILYWLRHIKNILKDGFKIMEIIIITTTTILQAFQTHILMICVGLV